MREFRIIFDPPHDAPSRELPHRELIGYPLPALHFRPGDTAQLAVSTTEPHYTARVVRLIHGDTNPAGPGHVFEVVDDAGTREAGLDGKTRFEGRLQETKGGSWGVTELGTRAGDATIGCWIWPTLPDKVGHEQVVLSRGAGGNEAKLYLDAGGRLCFSTGSLEIKSETPLHQRNWFFVAASVDAKGGLVAMGYSKVHDRFAKPVFMESAAPLAELAQSPWLAREGALYLATPPVHAADRLYNGKISDPFTSHEPITADNLAALISFPPSHLGLHAPTTTLFGAPTTHVASHRWRPTTSTHLLAPDEYRAVHFHEDDLDDAGWEPTVSYLIPSDLPSGVYAFRLDAEFALDGEPCLLWDEIPFFVSSPNPDPSKPLLIIPTLTYQIYSNERLIAGGEDNAMVHQSDAALKLNGSDPADRWLARHPEMGSSGYDLHRDGSGVHVCSLRRPIPNMRGGFRWWILAAPERFGADLYLVEHLHRTLGAGGFHVLTDHELHERGRAALDGYRCVIFPTHPEYWTFAMREALQGWLEVGGRGMYLGGNGFYWVTEINPSKPHLAEIRRANTGTRAWSSPPGERHYPSGVPGGLWREVGLPPNALCGVGFAAECDAPTGATGYRIAEDGRGRGKWVFEGCTEGEVFGAYGMFCGGAAGYEIDRFDAENGSPEEALVLATSAGMHPKNYLLVVEDVPAMVAEITGEDSERVRSDVVLCPVGKGWMFSVGSITWCGSLYGKGGKGDVATITNNVLGRFLADGDVM
ncbi:hypothetical protein DFJ74DRAFT_122075 [Hyaloraphidium curvatum]|nr:hypothetical protein DFJ74DRAFT_122075 [Hyaloraphidium curvatum]